MGHRFGIGIAFVLLFLALAAGAIGYNVGVSHGMALAAPAAGGAPGFAPYMWYRPWGFGFGFGPLLFLFFFFFVVRGLFWGGYYRRRWYGYGYGGGCGPASHLEEWHRRAHEQMNNPQAKAPERA